MKQAYAYLRVSGQSQVDGDGFPRQVAAIEKYALANGFEIVQIFREEGITGKSELSNRPALQALYMALESGTVTTIIIERLDRLARDLMVSETIIQDLQKHGYELISTCEPDLCSDDPSRKLVRQIFGAIAEYDRAMIVLKLRGARQRIKDATGRCEGVKPYGSLPGEAEALEQLREWAATGATSDHIAADMNALHYATRSGKPWRASTIRKILRRDRVN